MNPFDALRLLNRQLARVLKASLVIIFSLLVVDVLWGVASRYLLGDQAAWSEELARLLMVWLALLGAALAAREEQHLGLDVLVNSWPEDVKSWSQLLVHTLILIFAVSIMAWGGMQLVSQRFDSGQTLAALGVAKAWFYLALPVTGCLITLFSVEAIWSRLQTYLCRNKPEGIS